MAYVAVSALSHAGLVRDHNEDSLVVGPWTLCGTTTENPQTLLFAVGTPLVIAVADGLGGHPGGEVASALVARRLARSGPALDAPPALDEALQLCNRAVYTASSRSPDLVAMGTTVAGVLVLPGSVLAFNVGDSRVYAVGSDGLRQLSVDDSPPLPPGQRTTSVVTRTLGGSTGFRPVSPHVTAAPPAVGDRYLVCSDGLTDPVPNETIERLVDDEDDNHAAFRLWRAAIEAGGPDNITLALVRLGQ